MTEDKSNIKDGHLYIELAEVISNNNISKDKDQSNERGKTTLKGCYKMLQTLQMETVTGTILKTLKSLI
jgi:hypothetical protein